MTSWFRSGFARRDVRVALLAVAVAAGSFGVVRARHTSDAGCATGEHAACAIPAAPHATKGAAPAAAGEAHAMAVLPEGAVMVEFVSEECPACRRMAAVLEEAGRRCEGAGAPLVRLDVESPAGSELATTWGVSGTPTLVLLDAHRNEVTRLVGAQPLADVEQAMAHAYGLACASLAKPAPSGRAG